MNTAIFSPSGGNVGIAFAIPASLANDVVTVLIEDGTIERVWLGIQIQPVTDDIAESLGLADAKGALISELQDDSPAKKAGLKSGDIVTAVEGHPIDDPKDLALRTAKVKPGPDVEIILWRDGKSETVAVEVGTLKEPRRASVEDMPSNTFNGERLENSD